MLKNRIRIFENSICHPAFLITNSKIINDNFDHFKKLKSNKDRYLLLEKIWHETLNIKLSPSSPRTWKYMEFQSEIDKTIFLIKSKR